MFGLIIWCILLIVLAVCIMPWWFLPVVIIYAITINVMKTRPRR